MLGGEAISDSLKASAREMLVGRKAKAKGESARSRASGLIIVVS